RASLSVASEERKYVSTPSETERGCALAWTETKRSARCLLAKLVRSRSGTKTSVLRVRTTLTPKPSSIMRAARRVTSSTTSFSWMPLGPLAPGSWPPWPASSTISLRGGAPPPLPDPPSPDLPERDPRHNEAAQPHADLAPAGRREVRQSCARFDDDAGEGGVREEEDVLDGH